MNSHSIVVVNSAFIIGIHTTRTDVVDDTVVVIVEPIIDLLLLSRRSLALLLPTLRGR